MKKLVITAVVISILILNLVLISAEVNSPVPIERSPLSQWFINIEHNVGLFTTIGINRQCGIEGPITSNGDTCSSTLPNGCFNYANRVGVSSGTNVAVPVSDIKSEAECSQFLVDTFKSNWDYIGEWDVSQLSSDLYVPSGGWYEVYCCPHPKCTSPDNCVDWGTGTTCTTSTGVCTGTSYSYKTKTYTCNSQYGTWHYDGEVSSGNSRFCTPGSNYNNYVIPTGEASGVCETTKPAGWCTSCTPDCSIASTITCGTSFSDGCGHFTCIGTKGCSSTSCTNGQTQTCSLIDGCAAVRTCSGGTWGNCAKSNPTCDGTGDPGTTPGDGTGDPGTTPGDGSTTTGDIRINQDAKKLHTASIIADGVSVTSAEIGFGTNSHFYVPLKNYGTATETISLEAGFYSKYYAQNVAQLFAVTTGTSKPNCNPYEEFVSTKLVTLGPGEEITIDIEISPWQAFKTYGVGKTDLSVNNLVAFIGLYKQCLGGYINDAGTTGKGVMFDYIDYPTSCSYGVIPLVTPGVYITCTKNGKNVKTGSCSGNTLTLTETCDIPLTITLINEITGKPINTSVNGLPIGFVSSRALTTAKKFALTKEEISTSTSGDLLAASCLSDGQCLLKNESDDTSFTVKCIPISALRADGTLSKNQQDDFFTNAKTITRGTLYGATAGVSFCVVSAATVGLFGLGPGVVLASPAILGGCAALGGILGGTLTDAVLQLSNDDPLLKELDANNADKVGICTVKSKGYDIMGIFSKIGDVVKITGNPSTDGMIVVGALVFIIFLFMGAKSKK